MAYEFYMSVAAAAELDVHQSGPSEEKGLYMRKRKCGRDLYRRDKLPDVYPGARLKLHRAISRRSAGHYGRFYSRRIRERERLREAELRRRLQGVLI